MALEFHRQWHLLTKDTGDVTEDRCLQFLESLNFSPGLFRCSEMLFGDLSLAIVNAALDRLSTARALE